MRRRVAVQQFWTLKRAGFEVSIRQFSPDRDGWGVALGNDTLKTVAACELTVRADPQSWESFINAVELGL